MTTLEQFSSLVANIYDAALDPAQWDQTLRQVCSVTGGNNSALVLYDREKRRRPHIIAANFDPLQKRRYDEYFSRIDPLAPILERSPPGVVVTARSVTGKTALRRVLQRLGASKRDRGHGLRQSDGGRRRRVHVHGWPCLGPRAFSNSQSATPRTPPCASSRARIACSVGTRRPQPCPRWRPRSD